MKTIILLLVLSLYIKFPAIAQPNLKLSLFAKSFGGVMSIKHAGDQRLFVVEQAGIIKILNKNGTINPAPFLNITTKVRNSGEQGLLGLAFHPNYKQNGYFFINYINQDQNTVVARYQVSATDSSLANPLSEVVLFTITQPFSNHNGGDLHFGPDGYLYISSGDGGSGGDPQNNSQNLTNLLGKILRIDVNSTSGGLNYAIPSGNPFADGPGGNSDEIWSYGLRNPWRFSFDKLTGDMWIGDVGQNAYEEIDFEPANQTGGINYGWRCYEGTHAYNTTNCNNSYTPPVLEYAHDQGCSITGGYVYRGANYTELVGRYLYVDFCTGKLWTLKKVGSNWVNELVYQNSSRNFTTFGEDLDGELYIGTINGEIYKICETSWASSYPNLSLNDNPILSNTYQAGQSLSSAGFVPTNSQVKFYAFGSINLSPGFRAENGSVFSANVSGCLN
ncbi:MAG TPA: PQQ-dependent sugar dehydrogenase [Leadbetterella sp.]|nr:PQQ-dependent sugar dehydrogenase [Leadbetterella sp.]